MVGLSLLAACAAPDVAAPSISSSVTTTTTNPNVYLQQRAEGVQRLLDDLSRALVGGTVADVDGLLDASAAPELRTMFDVSVANLSTRTASASSPASPSSTSPSTGSGPVDGRGDRLRLTELRYALAPTEEAETRVPAPVQARLDDQGSSDSWVAPIELHYSLGGAALPGVDESEVVLPSQLVVARYGDDWKLVGDASILSEPTTAATLWSLPGLAVSDVPTAGGSSVIASYPDTTRTVGRLRELLPGAVAAVSEFWGDAWPRRAVVATTATANDFDALARTSSVAGAAAATIYARVDVAEHVATGQRVILSPSAQDLPVPALGVVLRHELTHVATRTQTATSAPMWLTEGVPEYVGRKGTYTRAADAAPDLAAIVRAGQAPAGLPTDQQFAVSSEEAKLAYQSAWSVAAFVADKYGQAKLKTLYLGVAASGDTARQDAAITSTLGLSRAQFIDQWRRWLIQEMR